MHYGGPQRQKYNFLGEGGADNFSNIVKKIRIQVNSHYYIRNILMLSDFRNPYCGPHHSLLKNKVNSCSKLDSLLMCINVSCLQMLSLLKICYLTHVNMYTPKLFKKITINSSLYDVCTAWFCQNFLIK